MDFRKFLCTSASVIPLLLLTASFQPLFAQTAPTLGTAQNFAILGSSTVTNTGPTVINGDLGLSPGTSVTGFPPGIVTGTMHVADAVAAGARADAFTAYNSLAGQPCNTDLSGMDLGGKILTAGVYCFSTSAGLTGPLVLDAQGNPNAVFIFQIGSTLITGSGSSVVLINGASPCNVFFQVGSSATLGTSTDFVGTIIALQSVTLNTSATLRGRAIGLNAAVSLDSNVVSVPACSGVATSGFLQVCKVAGAGIAVGTNFTFTFAGTTITVPAGPAPGGTCSTPVTLPTGTVTIAETIPGGEVVAGVSTLPNGLLVSSNLAAGTATVTVLTNQQTIVTFIDAVTPPPGTGFLQVCKVAGAGVTVGTMVTFIVAGTPEIISAGAAPGGTCGTPVQVPAGLAGILEIIPGGDALVSVSTLPSAALLVSSNLAFGTATVTVTAGGQTIVTFIDAATPTVPTNGFLQVCKVAGDGIVVNTPFSFIVAGTPVTISAGAAPGGTCSTVQVTAGPTVVTEAIPSGNILASVSTSPTAGLLVSSNLAAGTATVTVIAGAQTTVTFIDVVPTTGFLQVCKVAGTGIPVGTNFTFTFAGATFTVPAGLTSTSSCSPLLLALVGPAVVAEINPANSSQKQDGPFQIGYAANLNIGDSVVNVSNDGINGGVIGAIPATKGNICVNTYVFDPQEEEIGCCSCLVTPNGINSLSAKSDLISNNLTPAVPTSIVIKLVGSTPGIDGNGAFTVCNPATVSSAATLATTNGLLAWGTTLEPSATGGTYNAVSVPFKNGSLSPGTLLAGVSTMPSTSLLVSSNLAAGTATVTVTAGGTTIVSFTNGFPATPGSELAGLTQLCNFIQANGTGFGICKSCRLGALGGAKK
jgi:hypothetical protein